jgi:hypothetical protein
MSKTDKMLRSIGIATLALGAFPVALVIVRDIPGMMRELKIAKMGARGGWKQAH